MWSLVQRWSRPWSIWGQNGHFLVESGSPSSKTPSIRFPNPTLGILHHQLIVSLNNFHPFISLSPNNHHNQQHDHFTLPNPTSPSPSPLHPHPPTIQLSFVLSVFQPGFTLTITAHQHHFVADSDMGKVHGSLTRAGMLIVARVILRPIGSNA